MHGSDDGDGPSLVSNRTMDIVVALLLIGGSAIVISDSIRLGFNWREGEGPAPGYFPFYVAVVLGISSLVNLVRAVLDKKEADESFVSKPAFGRVMAVLVPTFVYVALIGGIGPIPGLGIYLASAIFIAGFMLVFGKDGLLKSILVGIAIPLALFLMFERWFLVPLPKGPIEAMLGFG